MRFVFHPSADRHGIEHADAVHAVLHAVDIDDQDDGSLKFHGPARNGVMMVEVGAREINGGWQIFHAMKSRKLR